MSGSGERAVRTSLLSLQVSAAQLAAKIATATSAADAAAGAAPGGAAAGAAADAAAAAAASAGLVDDASTTEMPLQLAQSFVEHLVDGMCAARKAAAGRRAADTIAPLRCERMGRCERGCCCTRLTSPSAHAAADTTLSLLSYVGANLRGPLLAEFEAALSSRLDNLGATVSPSVLISCVGGGAGTPVQATPNDHPTCPCRLKLSAQIGRQLVTRFLRARLAVR